MIGGVSTVVVEVEDQERAKRFWSETLGFEVVQDAAYGEERWLEVRTPDKAVALVLDLRKGARPTAQDPSLPTANVSFLRRRPPANPRRAHRPGGQVPPAAHPAALRLVVDLRGPRRQPLRLGAPRTMTRVRMLVENQNAIICWLAGRSAAPWPRPSPAKRAPSRCRVDPEKLDQVAC